MYNLKNDLVKSFSKNNVYLLGKQGKCGIVITAPHGGGVRPLDIPIRKYGKKGKDSYTRRIVKKLATQVSPVPYYLYCDLHRSRLDLNRDIEEGAQGNPTAVALWRAWQTILDSYISDAISKYQRVLYIDLHSQNADTYFHLGYGLNTRNYLKLMENYKIFPKSTMAGLGESQRSLLFGEGSISHSLTQAGFKVLVPKNDEQYFNGGYNITHFSRLGVGAVQIEVPAKVCRYDLKGVTDALAIAIWNFREKFTLGSSDIQPRQ